MSIIREFDNEPKFRVVEARFLNGEFSLARQILDTQSRFAKNFQEAAEVNTRYHELLEDQDTAGEFLYGTCLNDPCILTDTDEHPLQANWIVGTEPILPDDTESEQFIKGYCDAHTFTGTALVGHDDLDQRLWGSAAVEEFTGGAHGTEGVSYETEKVLRAEAEYVLESLTGDSKALLEIRDKVATAAYDLKMDRISGERTPKSLRAYTWEDAGREAMLTRDGHGAGFWEHDGLTAATEWAKHLGATGTWDLTIDEDLLEDWDPKRPWNTDGELTYISNDPIN